jgi:hypothetical protein
VQEEICPSQKGGSSTTSQVVDEEALALASKGKGKSKKKGSRSGAGGKKNIDFFKVKCFQCHMFGHFSSQCREKKKSKPQMEASAGVEESAKALRRFLSYCMYVELICHKCLVCG